MSLSLSMLFGSAHIFVNNSAAVWRSDLHSSTDERVMIHKDDPGFCVFCDYTVRVGSSAPVAFTLVSTSNAALLTLQDGTPVTERVNAGTFEYFKFFVTAPIADVEVVLNVFSGDPDLFLSTSEERPSATTTGVFESATAGAGEGTLPPLQPPCFPVRVSAHDGRVCHRVTLGAPPQRSQSTTRTAS